ncbi:MAG: inositol monophosphatase [Patescibacteria group bacterium]|jgi:myo-inositol-1(or 4)-monophosphatase
MTKELTAMIQAAEAAGKIVKSYFGEALEVTEKTSAIDLKTEADLKSEAAVVEILTKAFPDYGIYSEEGGGAVKASAYRFIVDPLDGTHNFTLGMPYFSVAIALVKGEEILAGVVYNPILEHLYYAEKGSGAWFGQTKLKVNNQSDLTKAVIGAGLGYDNYQADGLNEKIRKIVARKLDTWATSLDFCSLAAGKIEAIVNNNNDICDFTAGKLIALEAGAQVTDFTGQKEVSDLNQVFVISNGTAIHQQLLDIIAGT